MKTPRAGEIAALIQPDRVHRDLYLSSEPFALEQRHFFANTWSYLGHASQVPAAGDYLAVDIAGQPLLMVRQPDGAIRVLYNRCPHKGTQLASDACGNTGKFFRCPYHAWTFRLDGSPLAIRVIRPLAADRTLVEAWSFRAEGSPDLLFERSMTYNRLVFSPMSVVAHDDVHLFESIQRGLAAGTNEWVSLHRDFDPAELDDQARDVNGTSELLMRNQFRAWARYMTLSLPE